LSRRYAVLIALLLALVMAVSVFAGGCKPKNALQAIKKADKIVVGTSADYPPFEYVDETTGEYTGFDVELMEKIAEKLGVTVEWKDMDFSILLNSLQSGQIDSVIACMTSDAERQQQALFSNAYWVSPDAVLVNTDAGLTITDPMTDFPSLRVGVQSGTIQEAFCKDELVTPGTMPAANLSSYPRADQAVTDLVVGRLDAVFMDAGAAQAFTEMQPVTVALIYDLPGDPGVAVKLGEQELIDKINEAIQQLTDDGTIQQLAEKYEIAAALTEG
jgi:polar amino acid transport system substrate-binding protein